MAATWEFPVISENRSSSPIDARKLGLIWASLLVLKLALAVLIPPMADETYYWVWTHKLALSYFDHPGGIAWLLSLNPFDAVFFRWPVVLLVHLAWLGWLFFLRDRFDGKTALWFLTALCLHPLTGLGSIIATPDAPLFFFWSAAILLLWSWTERPRLWKLALLGFALGLAFCSKYHAVLWVLSLLPLFAFKDFRSKWSFAGLAITFVCGAVATLPVLIWNANHDWISFGFQLKHGLGRADWRPSWTWEHALGVLLFVGLWRWRADSPVWRKALWLLTTVPAAFFLLTSFRGPIELNWLGIAVPSALVLLALSRSRVSVVALCFWGLLTAVLAVFTLMPKKSAPEFAERLTEMRERRADADMLADREPLFATTYQMASQYWFLMKRPVWKVAGASRFDQYDMWPESAPPARFYLIFPDGSDVPGDLLAKPFDKTRIESLPSGAALWEIQSR